MSIYDIIVNIHNLHSLNSAYFVMVEIAKIIMGKSIELLLGIMEIYHRNKLI